MPPTPAYVDLYPTLLGSAWASLPLVVRRLHQEGRARGFITIERGRHWPAQLLARILGFPPAGESVPTLLAVERSGDGQIWSRRFGDHAMVSRQRLRGDDLLAERFGASECVFRLRPTARGIDYDLMSVALNLGGLRLPMPRFLAPRGEATTWAEGEGMGLDISISVPILGRILRYHGLVKPEGDEA